MTFHRIPIGFVLVALLAGSSALEAEDAPLPGEALRFFERKVRPLLAGSCYKCHGPKKEKGKLRLDRHERILGGGESGPAVVPGKPEESLVIKAVKYQDPDLQMPPKQKLSADQVSILVRWIELGAPWPKEDASAPARPGR